MKFCLHEHRRGAVVLIVLAAMVVLLGFLALALNLTWLSAQRLKLQQACEAAALAGAAELLDPGAGDSDSAADRVASAQEQAGVFFNANSDAVLRTAGPDPDVVAGWVDDPTQPGGAFTAWTGSGPVNSLLVRGVRRRSAGQAVVLWFGRFLGIVDAQPTAAARASIDQQVYGFRPDGPALVPLVPLLVDANSAWPPAISGAQPPGQDAFSVDPRTSEVTAGPDGLAEITLRITGASGYPPPGGPSANWLSLAGTATDFALLGQQITDGLAPGDLAAWDGSFALGSDRALWTYAAAPPNVAQAQALQATLLAIRGQKRIFPIGTYSTSAGQAMGRVQGFVAGCVVDCELDEDAMTLVVQTCTVETSTALVAAGWASNPWIGKVVLDE
jgi:hypothetical protein